MRLTDYNAIHVLALDGHSNKECEAFNFQNSRK